MVGSIRTCVGQVPAWLGRVVQYIGQSKWCEPRLWSLTHSLYGAIHCLWYYMVGSIRTCLGWVLEEDTYFSRSKEVRAIATRGCIGKRLGYKLLKLKISCTLVFINILFFHKRRWKDNMNIDQNTKCNVSYFTGLFITLPNEPHIVDHLLFCNTFLFWPWCPTSK